MTGTGCCCGTFCAATAGCCCGGRWASRSSTGRQAISVKGLYATQAEFDAGGRHHGGQCRPDRDGRAGPGAQHRRWPGRLAGHRLRGDRRRADVRCSSSVRHTRAEEESGRDELLRAAAIDRHARPRPPPCSSRSSPTSWSGSCVALSLVSVPAGRGRLGRARRRPGRCAAWSSPASRCWPRSSPPATRATYAADRHRDRGGLRPARDRGRRRARADVALADRLVPAHVRLLRAALVAARPAGPGRGRRGSPPRCAPSPDATTASGVLAARPGPARAGRGLTSTLGLAWRLQRGAVIGWALGLFLMGLSYGSLGSDVGDLIGDSSTTQDMMVRGGGDLIDGFYATCDRPARADGCGFGIASALRPRGEEASGRVEVLLATGLSRARWLLAHVAVTVLGTVLVVSRLGSGWASATHCRRGTWAPERRTSSRIAAVRRPGARADRPRAPPLRAVSPAGRLAWLGLLFAVVVHDLRRAAADSRSGCGTSRRSTTSRWSRRGLPVAAVARRWPSSRPPQRAGAGAVPPSRHRGASVRAMWQPEPGWQRLPGGRPVDVRRVAGGRGGREVVVKRLRRPDPPDAARLRDPRDVDYWRRAATWRCTVSSPTRRLRGPPSSGSTRTTTA